MNERGYKRPDIEDQNKHNRKITSYMHLKKWYTEIGAIIHDVMIIHEMI